MAPSKSPGYDAFLECCGSTAFAAQMTSRLPFTSLEHAIETSKQVWWNQVPIPGWLQAFAAHPRIGDVEGLAKRFSSDNTHGPASEQAAALNSGSRKDLEELAEWNKQYEAKFGYVFLICASGKSCLEVLAALKARFPNQHVDEIRVAAGEQQKITELRLRSMNAWPIFEKAKESMQKPATGSRPPITTHVLDVSLGAPGKGIEVMLEFCDSSLSSPSSAASDAKSMFTGDAPWSVVGSSVTNSDGRAGALMANSDYLQPGRYRLTFKTGEYFLKGAKSKEGIAAFYPYVSLIFEVKPSQVNEHFHVPLLISPYSYTTYRGS